MISQARYDKEQVELRRKTAEALPPDHKDGAFHWQQYFSALMSAYARGTLSFGAERGWVIRCTVGLTYFGVVEEQTPTVWLTDPKEALHFARREDAENYCKAHGWRWAECIPAPG